ncbi:unnamed protein product [Mytilus coruscus]|uniref:Uncharacterized protein n=1 Tax=Mytilus coruscus TaxID=42192 RepID=A0A6J8EMM3_MYTCO|nr:unnamed protein product [Mytilus coruscus]
MDREDRRRYFVVGSVIIEVVTPILQQHIITFWCCNDTNNCVHSGSLPLNYRQWGILYRKTPGPCRHNCHCKYTANPVQLDDPDISLSCIILLNCCNLTSDEYNTIQNLRQLKNNFLSHNTEGAITADEYKSVWTDLTSYVLQLDNTKEDNLIRIKSRPLDEALCHKYNAILLDIHQKLDELINMKDPSRTCLYNGHQVIANNHAFLLPIELINNSSISSDKLKKSHLTNFRLVHQSKELMKPFKELTPPPMK